MRLPVPFPDQARTRLERDGPTTPPAREVFRSRGLQSAERAFRQPAMRQFLEPVGDPTQQDIAAQAFGWRRLIETPPFIAQTLRSQGSRVVRSLRDRSSDGFAISAAATRDDAIPPQLSVGFGGRQSETELLLDRSCEEATDAVLLPVRCQHHLGDGRAVALIQQRQNAVLLRARALACQAALQVLPAGFGCFGLGFDLLALLVDGVARLALVEERTSSAVMLGSVAFGAPHWRSHCPKPRNREEIS